MEDRYQNIVYQVVSEVLQIDASGLKSTTRFSEIIQSDEEFYEIYELCCERLDVPLAPIVNSMPVYRQKVSDLVMNSWRNLAPFSPRIAQLLADADVEMEDETLASLAQTMRTGTYVSSGQKRPGLNPPRSRAYVISWAIGLYAGAFAIAFALTFLPCNPLCSDCSLSAWQQMKEMRGLLLAPATIVNAVAFLPGLWGLWQNGRREARKRAAAKRRI